jgi:hypothetical protein
MGAAGGHTLLRTPTARFSIRCKVIVWLQRPSHSINADALAEESL